MNLINILLYTRKIVEEYDFIVLWFLSTRTIYGILMIVCLLSICEAQSSSPYSKLN